MIFLWWLVCTFVYRRSGIYRYRREFSISRHKQLRFIRKEQTHVKTERHVFTKYEAECDDLVFFTHLFFLYPPSPSLFRSISIYFYSPLISRRILSQLMSFSLPFSKQFSWFIIHTFRYFFLSSSAFPFSFIVSWRKACVRHSIQSFEMRPDFSTHTHKLSLIQCLTAAALTVSLTYDSMHPISHDKHF